MTSRPLRLFVPLMLLAAGALFAATGATARVAVPATHTVTITSGPSGTVASTDATFTYVSTAAASFTCAIDGGRVAACGSGTQGSVGYQGLALGAHRFSVFAAVARPPHTARADRSWTVTEPPKPNKPPSASFTYAPAAPKPGEQVTFTSTSGDSDGQIADYQWDTDGDGVFGETGEPAGAGATTASRSFAAPGSYTVQLRVTDNAGASAVAAQVVVVAAPPQAVACPANTICFDDLKPGVDVGVQYKPQGVELGLNQSDPSGKAGVLPTIAGVAGAHSGGQVAQIAPCGKDFCSSTVYAKLDHGVHHVEVYAGGGSKVILLGLDAAGTPVAQASKSTGKATQTLLSITAAGPKIVYVQIGQDAPPGEQFGLVNLDDLKFDPPDPNAKPDFALHWLPVAPGLPLGISTGGSTSTLVYLTRFNGSKGNIVFSVKPSSLPNGVLAKFSPTIVYDNTTFQTTLTVTASASAAAVAPNTQLTVVAHPTSKSVAPADRTLQIPLDVRLSNFDVTVKGIEVNQGIQTQLEPYYTPWGKFSAVRCKLLPSLPVRDWTDLSKPVPYETFKDEPLFPESPLSKTFGEGWSSEMMVHKRYGGVELVAGRKTVVRVFASVATPFGGSVANVPAALYGTRHGKALPGSPLPPDDGAKTLSYSELPWTTCRERANPKGAYTFTLPESWRHEKIELKASVTPQDIIFGPGAECGSPACAANNSLTLSEVNFNYLSYITVTPVQMSFSDFQAGGQVDPPLPGVAFADAFYMTPATVYLDDSASDYSYSGVIDIDDEVFDPDLNGKNAETKEDKKQADIDQCSALLAEIYDWADDNPHGDETVGVFSTREDVCPGTSHVRLNEDHEAFSVVAANQPLASVAHEMFHGMGRLHASGCGDPAENTAESWLPDDRGQIEGIGLDTRAGSGNGNGLYQVIVPGALLPGDVKPSEYNDFMSYCRKGVWISDRGWNDTVRHLREFQTDVGRLPSSVRRRPRGATMRVTAIASPLGVRIVTVKPGNGRRLTGRPSGYRLVLHGGAGQVVSDTPLLGAAVGAHTRASTLILNAEVPAAGAASLEIALNGRVVARRLRSAHAPRLKVVAPRGGARIGKGRVVVVRWRTTDADRGKLRAKIDYSTNGGRRWREIFAGTNHGAARLPSSLFSGSRRARLRLRVSDGFNQGIALSRVFTAVGRPPVVRIVSPLPRQRAMADGRLYLEGRAYDDTGRIIRGKRLRWFAGKNPLGAGSPLSVSGLHVGVRTIRLVATDIRGRRASASVRVRVVPATPRLLALRVPGRLSPRARRLVVRIAATMPARLTAAAKSFQIDRHLRRVVLPVHPGKGGLRLRLHLTAGARTSHVTLVVRRR